MENIEDIKRREGERWLAMAKEIYKEQPMETNKKYDSVYDGPFKVDTETGKPLKE